MYFNLLKKWGGIPSSNRKGWSFTKGRVIFSRFFLLGEGEMGWPGGDPVRTQWSETQAMLLWPRWGCWKMCVPCLIRWQHQLLQVLRIRRQGGVGELGKGCRRKPAVFFLWPQKGWVLKKNPWIWKIWERYIHFVENNTRCEYYIKGPLEGGWVDICARRSLTFTHLSRVRPLRTS